MAWQSAQSPQQVIQCEHPVRLCCYRVEFLVQNELGITVMNSRAVKSILSSCCSSPEPLNPAWLLCWAVSGWSHLLMCEGQHWWRLLTGYSINAALTYLWYLNTEQTGNSRGTHLILARELQSWYLAATIKLLHCQPVMCTNHISILQLFAWKMLLSTK